jgi:DNA recombination protein RmuC
MDLTMVLILLLIVIVGGLMGYIGMRRSSTSSDMADRFMAEIAELKEKISVQERMMAEKDGNILQLTAEREVQRAHAENASRELIRQKGGYEQQLVDLKASYEQQLQKVVESHREQLETLKTLHAEQMKSQLELIREQMQTTSEKVLK